MQLFIELREAFLLAEPAFRTGYLWFYYLAIGFGALSYLEKIIILMIIDEIAPGKKGLYWILTRKNEKK